LKDRRVVYKGKKEESKDKRESEKNKRKKKMFIPELVWFKIKKFRRRSLFQDRIKKFEKIFDRPREERPIYRGGIFFYPTPIGIYKIYPAKGKRKTQKQLILKDKTYHFG
jgi:hypothetical protein